MQTLLLKLFFLLLAAFSLNAASPSLEPITLQLQWKHQFEFAGFYAAKEQGYYKDVGLDVTFRELDNEKSITQRVLDGDAQYGLTYSSLIVDYYQGKPLVFVANFFKQSPLVLIAQEEIDTLGKLVGKKIMGLADSIDTIMIGNMFKKFGIHKDDYVNVKTDYKLDAFREKKVDAITVFNTNEIYALDKLGIKYKIFDPITYGINYYDLNLFTTQDELRKHPQRVENFRAASIKGWKYALSHKNELVDIILQKYNTQFKTREALMFEARQIESVMLSNIYKIGSIDKKRVESIRDDFLQVGYIDSLNYKNLNNFIYTPRVDKFFLTDKEKEYLQNKKTLRMCVDPERMPFGALRKGRYIGIDTGFVEILEEEMGKKIKIIKSKTWEESLYLIKHKKCDFISLVTKMQKKESYLNITSPYLHYPLVIVTKTNKINVPDVSFLRNKRVAVVQGNTEIELIKKNYPNLKVVTVKSVQDGLKYVSDEKVYGFVDNAFGIDYYFQNVDYSEFKISTYFNEKFALSYGVRSDERELYNIIEKIVLNISDTQRSPILNQWFSHTYKKNINYMLYLKIFTALAVIILFFLVRHYNIKKLNQELQRRVQEELEKSKSKDKMLFLQNKHTSMGEMMGNIAHQWRQPLTQINSAVLVLDDLIDEQGIVNTDIETKLEEIESLTSYMSKTISDFKNFYDTDKDKENFILQFCIDEAIDIVASSLHQNNIELVVSGSSNQACYSYPSELKQAIVILFNNAKDVLVIKKIKKAKIVISVSVNLTITICDNGGGVDSKIIQRIFEPYFTTKHKSQGTGLGLYIAKLIIEDSLGGKLSVSNSNRGACFTIRLKGTDDEN